jgi:flavin-dependent dehydrogenase
MRPFDVLVIGGGPAGATAALLLARAGRSVAVLEKTAFPRRKVCGEYIAPPAASFLRTLGIAAEPRVRRIAVWAGNRALQAPLPAPYASTLARDELDEILLAKAAESGATIFQPLKAVSLERGASGFLCTTTSAPIEARTVIAAHGSWEPGHLPTQERHPPKPSDLLAFKAHFRSAELAPDTIALAPFPGGYGGLLMLGDGRATYACCIRREALEDVRRAGVHAGDSVLDHGLAASAGLRAALGGVQRDGVWLASGPLRPGLRAPYRDGVFAVGNAAGEVHPIVGQGISLAVQSAILLARTFGSPGVYERECRRLYAGARWRSALIARAVPHAPAEWALRLGVLLGGLGPAGSGYSSSRGRTSTIQGT